KRCKRDDDRSKSPYFSPSGASPTAAFSLADRSCRFASAWLGGVQPETEICAAASGANSNSGSRASSGNFRRRRQPRPAASKVIRSSIALRVRRQIVNKSGKWNGRAADALKLKTIPLITGSSEERGS